jgi:hypothetical protein
MRQAGRKAYKLACRATDKKSFMVGGTIKNSSKLNELRGNLYENKGTLWKTRGEAGMSMKTMIVSR